MLIVTAKLPRRKLAFGAAAAALLCCAALVLNLVPAGYRAAARPCQYPQLQGDPDQHGPCGLSQRLRLAGPWRSRLPWRRSCIPGGDGRELPPLSGAPGRPGL